MLNIKFNYINMKLIVTTITLFLVSGSDAQLTKTLTLTPSTSDTLKLQASTNYIIKPVTELSSLFIKLPVGFAGAKITIEIDSPGLSAPPVFIPNGANIQLPYNAYYIGEPSHNWGNRHKLLIQWNSLLNKWY
jgi:hypothetical protein